MRLSGSLVKRNMNAGLTNLRIGMGNQGQHAKFGAGEGVGQGIPCKAVDSFCVITPIFRVDNTCAKKIFVWTGENLFCLLTNFLHCETQESASMYDVWCSGAAVIQPENSKQ